MEDINIKELENDELLVAYNDIKEFMKFLKSELRETEDKVKE